MNLLNCFWLAFTVPSCSGPLFDDIGFVGDTKQVQQILKGTYSFPPNTDPATKLLLEEASITYLKMYPDDIGNYVTVDDFQYYRQWVNKRISSNFSDLHFGHYKAASFDNNLLALHAAKLPLCACTGTSLVRWGEGITVLLEKVMGNNYINKL